MHARRVIAGLVALAIGLAYIAGYWPEHQRRVAHEADAAALRERLADSEARVRMGRLLGEILTIREAVVSLNYGNAQQLSSTFFDGVRAEASLTPVAAFKTALEAILQSRDQVTAALARGDQAAVEPLRRAELQLREALGYPISGPP
jgi:hypothetical protein